MKKKTARKEYCQWHETMETPAECATKPTTPTTDTLYGNLDQVLMDAPSITQEQRERIIAAVNHHQELIDALRYELNYMEDDEHKKKVVELIARAEGVSR